MVDNKYKRVLLKISGEALLGDQQFGIDPKPVEMIADEIRSIYERGVEIAVVVGGGNIFRGVSVSSELMDRTSADYMGMMGTVMNAIAIEASLNKIGVKARFNFSKFCTCERFKLNGSIVVKVYVQSISLKKSSFA